jgi:glycosyltransferase involved in cell wall biosynthesis
VVFAGFMNQGAISRAYVAADVLVMPSTWETWGLAANEAMASGVPCVVTEGVACAGDLVVAGESGLVTPVGDVEALAGAISRLADDADLTTALGDGARRIVARFDLEAAVQGTLRALEILGRRGQSLAATSEAPTRRLA